MWQTLSTDFHWWLFDDIK